MYMSKSLLSAQGLQRLYQRPLVLYTHLGWSSNADDSVPVGAASPHD